jgi:signal transduction histidine kinase
MSFRARLTLAYLALLTLTLTAFGVGVYAYVDRKLHHELYASAQNQANAFALSLTNYQTAEDVNNLMFGANQLRDRSRKVDPDLYVQVMEAPRPPVGKASPPSQQLQVNAKTATLSSPGVNLPIVPPNQFTVIPARLTGPINRPMVAYAEDFVAIKPQSGAARRPLVGEPAQPPVPATTINGRVIVAVPLDKVGASLRVLRTILIGGGLAVLATAALIGSGLATWLLRPLARMRTTAQQIGDQRDFTRRMRVEGNPANQHDELARLSLTFNQMLTELEQAHVDLVTMLEAQRRFVADASHELRTPLTAIRTNVEFLSRVPAARPEDRGAALHDVLVETRRMETLVGDLLALARLEAATSARTPSERGAAGRRRPVEAEPWRSFRLDHLVADVHRDALRHAGGKVEVRLGPLPEVWVAGDRDDLRRALWNLVDNALKYTPEGWVELGLEARERRAALRVADSGIGISEEHLGHVFDRFWRAPSVRGTAGSGLGLAITRWVAELHGGTVTVRSTLGEGTVFTLELPTSPPPPRRRARRERDQAGQRKQGALSRS